MIEPKLCYPNYPCKHCGEILTELQIGGIGEPGIVVDAMMSRDGLVLTFIEHECPDAPDEPIPEWAHDGDHWTGSEVIDGLA